MNGYLTLKYFHIYNTRLDLHPLSWAFNLNFLFCDQPPHVKRHDLNSRRKQNEKDTAMEMTLCALLLT